MNKIIEIFVHGVPKGHEIWGAKEYDRLYLESFYSNKQNVDPQLQIDIIKHGTESSYYYTYLKCVNILDKDNRAGSYFGITIKLNALYNDLFNIYCILDASYHKYIVNYILKTDNVSTKYIIDDFEHINDQLKNLENVIKHYLSVFSTDSDFETLNIISSTEKSDIKRVNLLDCKNPDVLKYLKDKQSISLSPAYQSLKLLDYIRKSEEDKILTQNQLKKEKEKIVAAFENAKKELDLINNKLNNSNKQLEIEKDNSKKLRNEISNYGNYANQLNQLKQIIQNIDIELINCQNELTSIKQFLSRNTNKKIAPENNKNISNDDIIKSNTFKSINRYLPITNTVLILLILILSFFIIFRLISYNTSIDTKSNIKNVQKHTLKQNVNLPNLFNLSDNN